MQNVKYTFEKILQLVLTKNTIGAYLLQVDKGLFGVLILPLLASRIGITAFGSFSAFMSLCTIAGVIVDWGFSQSAVRSLAVAKIHEKARIAGVIIQTKFSLTWPISIVVMLICSLAPSLAGHMTLEIYAVLVICFSSFSPIFIFQALEKTFDISIVLLAVRLLLMVLIASLVKTENDLNIAFSIYLISIILGIVLGWLILFIKYKFRVSWSNVLEIKLILTKESDMALANIGANFYGGGSTFLLSLVCSSAQVGLYSLSLTFVRGACSVLSPISQSYLPKMARMWEESIPRARIVIRKALLLQIFVSSVLMALVWITANYLNAIITKNNLSEMLQLIKVLSPTILFTSVSSMLTLLVIIPLGLASYYKNLVVSSSVLGSTSILVMGYFYQGYGGALCISVVEMIVCFLILIRSMQFITSELVSQDKP
jgi:PST family polysaccharide transporter